MYKREAGRVMESNTVHRINAPSPIVFKFCGNVTDLSEEQKLNVCVLSTVRPLGRVIEGSALAFSNARSPICVTVSGMDTYFKFSLFRKASAKIRSTTLALSPYITASGMMIVSSV